VSKLVKKRNLSKIGYSDLMETIRRFEKKYGKDFHDFSSELEENRASFEELVDKFEWEQYMNEMRKRSELGRLELNIRDAKEFTEIFTPLRLDILGILAGRGEASVSEIAEAIRRPVGSVSEMLKILESKGIVTSKRKGKRKIYRLLVKEIILRISE